MLTTVFKVIGFEMKSPNLDFMESCVFWVYANSEKEALAKAKRYGVKKPHYQVLEVIEKYEDVTA